MWALWVPLGPACKCLAVQSRVNNRPVKVFHLAAEEAVICGHLRKHVPHVEWWFGRPRAPEHLAMTVAMTLAICGNQVRMLVTGGFPGWRWGLAVSAWGGSSGQGVQQTLERGVSAPPWGSWVVRTHGMEDGSGAGVRALRAADRLLKDAQVRQRPRHPGPGSTPCLG